MSGWLWHMAIHLEGGRGVGKVLSGRRQLHTLQLNLLHLKLVEKLLLLQPLLMRGDLCHGPPC